MPVSGGRDTILQSCGGALKCSLWLEYASRELLTAPLHVARMFDRHRRKSYTISDVDYQLMLVWAANVNNAQANLSGSPPYTVTACRCC